MKFKFTRVFYCTCLNDEPLDDLLALVGPKSERRETVSDHNLVLKLCFWHLHSHDFARIFNFAQLLLVHYLWDFWVFQKVCVHHITYTFNAIPSFQINLSFFSCEI
jgi:hypothetical protein